MMLLGHISSSCVEHVLGHHKNVATAHDPATSRRGESLYRFLPRTLTRSLVGAWRLEGARVARVGHRPFGPRDRLGPRGRGGRAGVRGRCSRGGRAGARVRRRERPLAALLLEVINYVEHYGLVRAGGGARAIRVGVAPALVELGAPRVQPAAVPAAPPRRPSPPRQQAVLRAEPRRQRARAAPGLRHHGPAGAGARARRWSAIGVDQWRRA